MTSWQLDQFCAQPVSGYPALPTPGRPSGPRCISRKYKGQRGIGPAKTAKWPDTKSSCIVTGLRSRIRQCGPGFGA
jgi:hypothetical protein